ncbi:hypothetical protein ACVBE9_10035 [Eionea flava]
MPTWIHNKTLRLWLPPIAGFLAYGGWALFINFSHGWYSAAVAGLTQGSYSFTVTLLLAIVIEYLFSALNRTNIHTYWRNISVFITGFSLLVVTSVGVNVITGTPEVLWTVLPGLSVSAVYTVVYILALGRVEDKAASGKP